METNNLGAYLARLRKKRGHSLHRVVQRMRGRRVSKQALSLIERARMKVPAARLTDLKKAYQLSMPELMEFDRLYAFERLVEHTGEDREFGEAVLSVVDPQKAGFIYVVGGRRLSLTSPVLQEKAAEFLQETGNKLIFIYPDSNYLSTRERPIWFANTQRQMLEMKQSIQAFSKLPVKQNIEFYAIDPRKGASNPLVWDVLSLCGPFTSTTVAGSIQSERVAGYIYVEGPRDRWVLLNSEHAKRVMSTVTLFLAAGSGSGAILKQEIQDER
jgi:transcriptional regulator with XRE-family HTH domain